MGYMNTLYSNLFALTRGYCFSGLVPWHNALDDISPLRFSMRFLTKVTLYSFYRSAGNDLVAHHRRHCTSFNPMNFHFWLHELYFAIFRHRSYSGSNFQLPCRPCSRCRTPAHTYTAVSWNTRFGGKGWAWVQRNEIEIDAYIQSNSTLNGHDTEGKRTGRDLTKLRVRAWKCNMCRDTLVADHAARFHCTHFHVAARNMAYNAFNAV